MKLNKEFSREEIHVTIKHFIIFKISLAMKEMQISITLKFHITPVRTATKNNGNKCLCIMEHPFTLSVNVK